MAWENEDIEYEFYANRNRVLRDSKAKAQEDLNRTGAGLDDASVILSDPQAVLDHSVDVKFFPAKRDTCPGPGLAQYVPQAVLGRARLRDLRVQPAYAARQREPRNDEAPGSVGRGFSSYHPPSPAGAGIDRQGPSTAEHNTWFPRRRGDRPTGISWRLSYYQVPPQARG